MQDFPYYVEQGIAHDNIWSTTPLTTDELVEVSAALHNWLPQPALLAAAHTRLELLTYEMLPGQVAFSPQDTKHVSLGAAVIAGH